MTAFSKLFSPGRIGELDIKNRIVMPPMGTCLGNIDGSVSKKLIDYYAERAKGGVGLIIVENTLVDSRHGIQIPNQLRIDDYRYVPQLYELVEAVHWGGAKVAIQINAGGSGVRSYLSSGLKPLAPSSVKLDLQPEESRPLTIDEIKELVQDFVKSARFARMAGFDAVEIHAANGYMISAFLSPYCNRRTDAYGGDFEGRLRLCLEVITEVRKEVGPDFPVLLRLGVDDFIDGGMNLNDSVKIAQRAELAGINALDITASNLNIRDSSIRGIPPIFVPKGHLVKHARRIKEALSIPVIVSGRIKEPELAEEILQEGNADFIAMGRALISDPEWPQKTQRGQTGEIRRCLSCNDLCVYRKSFLTHPIRCTVNPMVGREAERIASAEKPKRVVVVGGGPAGMEAARVSALRGHEVVLYEKSSELGGALSLASVPPCKEDLKYYVDYLVGQLAKHQVTVLVNREFTAEMLSDERLDAIVIATGAKTDMPDLPGIGNENVYLYDDVLVGRRKVAGQNVIVAGGGMIGCETALHLAEREGKKVTIMSRRPDLALDVEPIYTRTALLKRLGMDGIDILTNSKIQEVLGDRVRFSRSGRDETVGMDSLVVVPQRSSDRALASTVRKVGVRPYVVYEIGDCVSPRKLPDAVHEGFATALRI